MTLPEAYQANAQHIQPSPKFQPQSPGEPWRAVPFPGYTIITPPWEDEVKNGPFYSRLKQVQQQLLEKLPPNLLIPVPPESFHMTLADLIWDTAYQHAQEKPEFEAQLCDCTARIFQQYESADRQVHAMGWQILGFLLMTRAIGVCLAPKEEHSYEEIVQFRRAIYQNPELIALGIEQQYHLTAHVTLGYLGDVPSDLDQDSPESKAFASHLSHTLTDLNQQWLNDEPHELLIHQAELRKFDDMNRYYRHEGWPVVKF
ncbi:DUF1868 domain-containing protein [Leptolyngbya sp. 'hensonii']|uniref:DUF1868 domain-containing protein n=1 Tax=Leptolyngbya sp. 'hensonii' TaxID=1922337 RepID=UPI000AE8803C|nr:DUF1868 domain-containing protein [Leptolyngbya sp. 'hensonii']